MADMGAGLKHSQRMLPVRKQVDFASAALRNRYGLRAAGIIRRASESLCLRHPSLLTQSRGCAVFYVFVPVVFVV